ncbi:hypothetical protein BC936DRAFT_146527 [Jimgerdemannia flammicorona]|uniref:Ricin B lectin domain-containing protein n=1 Tax=Jimgerdemannia flammicorona TaxID=994334 RepID=A0A433D7H1_9FUNG|nr:hypothetical protein BC936DRAFT_146527 [Jimgerdemannia flammicorona]
MKAVSAMYTATAMVAILLSAYTTPVSSKCWPSDTYTYIIQHGNNSNWHWSLNNGSTELGTAIINSPGQDYTLNDYFTLSMINSTYLFHPRNVRNNSACVVVDNSGFLQLSGCDTSSGDARLFWINCDSEDPNLMLSGCLIQPNNGNPQNFVVAALADPDTGVSRIVINSNIKSNNQTWNLILVNRNPAPSPPNITNITSPNDPGTGLNVVTIATIVVGSIVFLMVISLGFIFYMQRKRRITTVHSKSDSSDGLESSPLEGSTNNTIAGVLKPHDPNEIEYKPEQFDPKPNS